MICHSALSGLGPRARQPVGARPTRADAQRCVPAHALHCSSTTSSSSSSSRWTGSRRSPTSSPSSSSSASLQGSARWRQHRQRHPLASWVASAVPFAGALQAAPEPIPDDVQLEINPDAGARDVLYDEGSKTVRIPLAALADTARRSKMVMFRCNKCGGRSARLVNPLAWDKGAVFCQCQHCQVWHMLRADKSIVEEIRYNDPEWQQNVPAGVAAAGAAALAASGGVAELVAGDGDATSEASSSTAQHLGTSSSNSGGTDDEASS